MIEYSRHSRRRMRLYGITEHHIEEVIREGQLEVMDSGRMAFTAIVGGSLALPIRVLCRKIEGGLLVVTAYPLKKGRTGS
jgi:hypothetical protein